MSEVSIHFLHMYQGDAQVQAILQQLPLLLRSNDDRAPRHQRS